MIRVVPHNAYHELCTFQKSHRLAKAPHQNKDLKQNGQLIQNSTSDRSYGTHIFHCQKKGKQHHRNNELFLLNLKVNHSMKSSVALRQENKDGVEINLESCV